MNIMIMFDLSIIDQLIKGSWEVARLGFVDNMGIVELKVFN